MVKRFSINKAYIFKIYVGKIHACEGESEQERLDSILKSLKPYPHSQLK